MPINALVNDELSFDQKARKSSKFLLGYGTQIFKPILPITSVATLISAANAYPYSPSLAATYATLAVVAFATHKILTSPFAQNLVSKTKDTEWRSATYSQKNFKDSDWNTRFSAKAGPTYTAVNMYNHFVIKHNHVMDFFKFDTLVKFGVKAVVHMANANDEFSQRLKEVSKATGLWSKIKSLVKKSKNIDHKKLTGINVLDEISKIAPTIEGFITNKADGPSQDLFEVNDKVISRSHDRYLLNNSYFSFAMLHSEIITAINNDDRKLITKLSNKDGIGHFINTFKYTGNTDYKPLSDMARSLRDVMDNYKPGDSYYFPLSSGHNDSNSIQDNTKIIFKNLQSNLTKMHDLNIDVPITISNEMLRQVRPAMEEKLAKNAVSSMMANKQSINENSENDLIFTKSQKAADDFADKIEKKFARDIEY
jgi:hypothetical protein